MGRSLLLKGCAFTGTIPSGVSALPLLTTFNVKANQLVGTIPGTISAMGSLVYVCLLSAHCSVLTAQAPLALRLPPYCHSLCFALLCFALLWPSYAFMAFHSETHTQSSYNNRQAIEACWWQLRWGGRGGTIDLHAA